MNKHTEEEVQAIAKEIFDFAETELPQLNPVDYIFMGFRDAEQRLLKQCSVIGCKELLAQMSKEENEALGKANFNDLYNREKHANQKYCLAIVLQMLEERQAL